MSGISEKKLEDFVCLNLDYVLSEQAKLIGRQINLPHGRLDVLAWGEGRTLIIELKAVAIREKDVGQVLRYRADVRAIMEKTGWARGPKVNCAFLDAWEYYHSIRPSRREPPFCPVLVGPGISDRVLAAAEGAGITVRVYRIDENNCIEFFNPMTDWRRETFADRRGDYEGPPWAVRLSDEIDACCRNDIEYVNSGGSGKFRPANWFSWFLD